MAERAAPRMDADRDGTLRDTERRRGFGVIQIWKYMSS
jgi:hypothetical protein